MTRSFLATLGLALASTSSIVSAAGPTQPAACANVTIASVAYSGTGCPSGSAQQSITNQQQTVSLKFSKFSGANSVCTLNVGVSYPQVGDFPCSSMASWTVTRKGSAQAAGIEFPMDVLFMNRTWGDEVRSNIATVTAKEFVGDWTHATVAAGQWTHVDMNNFTFTDPNTGSSLSQGVPLAPGSAPKGWPTQGRKVSKRQDAVAAEAAANVDEVYTPSALQPGQSQLSIEDELAAISKGLGSSKLWGKEKRQATVARTTVMMKIDLGVGGPGSVSELDLKFATGVNDPLLA